MEAPEISEEEIRKQIMEEFEAREKIKMAQLEEEIKRAEQEKQEEIRGTWQIATCNLVVFILLLLLRRTH